MVPKAFPPWLTLPPSVRLATAADATCMADLSVLGFRDSAIFRYERPRYRQFPHDAVAAFANLYRAQLRDPRTVVVVVEDGRRPDDASHVPPPNKDGPDGTDAPEQPRVVVGVASWVFPEGSPRAGQPVVAGVGDPEPALDRDLCRRRLDLFTRMKEVEEKKYFTGMSICDKLVVHPSYRRRGHATSMLQWGQRLSVMDAVDRGVMPSHLGEPIYKALGYEFIGEVHIPNDGEVEGFSQRVLVYRGKR